jgi:hypothetical protein
MWSPGWFGFDLLGEGEIALAASTEPWELFAALSSAEALAPGRP